MSDAARNIIIDQDERHEAHMAKSAALLENAIRKARGQPYALPRGGVPEKLIWRKQYGSDCNGFEKQDAGPNRDREARTARRLAAKEEAQAAIVKRDPCPICGIRLDLHANDHCGPVDLPTHREELPDWYFRQKLRVPDLTEPDAVNAAWERAIKGER